MVAIFTGAGTGLANGSASTLGGSVQIGGATQGRGGEQVSVNAATGNLVVSRQDEFLAGIGFNASVSRTFNSQANFADDRDNGDGWQQSTTKRLFGMTGTLNTIGSTIKRLDSDGSVTTYTFTAGGPFGYYAHRTTDGAGAHDYIYSAGAEWGWVDGDSQVTEKYSAAYGSTTEFRLYQSVTPGYRWLNYSYLANSNLLDKVTNANGDWLKYAYNASNQIEKIETGYIDHNDSDGDANIYERITLTRTWYEYTSGRLSLVRTDLTPGDNTAPTNAQSYWTAYGYDALGRVNLITQKDGSQLAVAYDGSGRVTTLTQTISAGVTRVTSLVYNAGNTQVIAPYPAGANIADFTTTLHYDAAKQLTKIVSPPAFAGATAQEVNFAYDAAGNVNLVTNADGEVTDYDYDALGNTTKVTKMGVGSPNIVADRTYDNSNRLTLESWSSVSDGAAAPTTNNKRYVYGSSTKLEFEIDAAGHVREYVYDGNQLLLFVYEYTSHTYPAGTTVPTAAAMATWRTGLGDLSSRKVLQYFYDGRGNVKQVRNYGAATAAGASSTAEGYTDKFFVYDPAGQLLSTRNGTEAAETFQYDGLGRMTYSASPASGTTSIVFNDTGSSTQITTAGSYVVTKTYNLAGELIAQTGATAGTAQLSYDSLGRLRYAVDESGDKSYTVYDKAGRMVGQVNHHGDLIEYRYDQANRLIATTRYKNAVTAGNLITLANPDNALTMANIRPTADAQDIWSWTVYDNAGRVVQTIDGDGGVVAFVYDDAGNLLKTTAYFNTVAVAGLKTTLPLAAVATTANAAKDAVTRNFYDRSGRRLGTLDAEGYLTWIRYDEAGQAVETVAYAQKATATLWAAGTLAALQADVVTTADTNRRSVNVYDGQGLLRYQLNYQQRSGVNDLWQVTQFGYNTAGQATQSIVRNSTITIANAAPNFTYAAVKALVAANPTTNDRTATTAYDAAGRVATKTDHTGLVTTFTYDAAGRVIKTVTGTGATTQRVTRTYYSAAGFVLYQIDPEGFVTKYDYEFDGLNNLVRRYDAPITATDTTTIANIQSLVGTGFVDTTITYDNADRVYTARNGESEAGDTRYLGTGLVGDSYGALGTLDEARHSTAYTGAGRLSSTTAAVGDVNAVTSVVYDGLGNKVQVTDPRGKITSYSYDRRGLLLSETNVETATTTTYEYNAFGEVVKATDARGNSSYSYYDELGRMNLSRDAENFLTETSYTRFGEIASVTRRFTASASAYSTTTRPTTSTSTSDATTAFTYNAIGQLTRTTDALGHYESYSYTQFGERLTVVAKSETNVVVDATPNTTTYAYDRRGLLTSVTLPIKSASNASIFIKTSYTYDARGNRLTMVEADGLPEARTTNYVYDKADRLIETRAQARTIYDQDSHEVSSTTYTPIEKYFYDERGNVRKILDSTGYGTTFFYDDLNRKTVEVGPLGAYTGYAYDKNGNVTSIRIYENRITTATLGGASSTQPAPPSGIYRETTFTYDALNRMASSTVVLPSGYKTGTWNGTIWTNAATTGLVTTYEYDAAGNVVKTTDPGGNTIFAYYDKLGRKIAQVDAEARLTKWTYNAEGNVIEEYRFYNRVGEQNGYVASTSSTLQLLEASALYGLDDRMTVYGYDLVGNRVHEGRLNVQVFNPATNGQTAAAGSHAFILYTYNGLGQVLTKREAAPNTVTSTYDTTTYTYDDGGRLTSEVKPGYTDHGGLAVTPTVTYTYDGLGNLKSLAQAGNANALARTTTYVYGAGGLLSSVTDSEGKVTSYGYDMAGRTIVEQYQRTESSGTTTHTEAKLTSFDVLGQVIEQTVARWNSSTGNWDKGDISSTTYNTFGDVIATGVNGAAVADGVVLETNLASYSAVVYRLYDMALGREPLPPEIAWWAGQLAIQGGFVGSFNWSQGQYSLPGVDMDAVEWAATAILGDPGVSDYLSGDDATFIKKMYRGSLHRDPAAWEVDTWLNNMNAGGMSRGALLAFFTEYSEHRAFTDTAIQAGFAVTGGPADARAWQQQNKYDLAGRLWATNSGDGVWKYFGYDNNGNQTIAVTSAGENLASVAANGANTYFETGDFAGVQAISDVDVNATYTVYNARNLATQVVEEQRQTTSTATSATLTTNRTYNSFGEVATETNAAGAQVKYTYNTMGKMIRSEAPTVQMTKEDGTTHWIRPSEDFYYDYSGRLVAQRDANGTYAAGGTSTQGTSKAADTGNLTRLTLLAGTGYNGSQALVTQEIHADGGIKQTKYDIHGNARVLIDEENRTLATNSYDMLGRLTSAVRIGGLTDTYTYDILGQQVTHWNSLNGSSNKETSDFDVQGRVISTRAFGGLVTNVAYAWDATLEAGGTGLIDSGGWSQTTTYTHNGTSLGRTAVEKSDVFGRAVYKSDLGSNVTSYTYDVAGRMTQSAVGTSSYNYEYYNTGQASRAFTVAPNWAYYTSNTTAATAASFVTTTTQSAAYTYDLVGNRLTEVGTLTSGATSVSFKNHTALYDALGRLTSVVSAATTTQQSSTVGFTYDAAGNVRSKTATYRTIAAAGGYSTSDIVQTSWYRHDTMNRVVVNNGQLVGGVIVRKAAPSVDFIGDPSQTITYNKAGQRTTMTTSKSTTTQIWVGDTPYGPINQWYPVTYEGYAQENYTYDAAGRLYQILGGETGFDSYGYTNALIEAAVFGQPNPSPAAFVTPVTSPTLRSQFGYDVMGRQTVQYGYAANGSTIQQATTAYDGAGLAASSFSSTLRTDTKTYTQTVTNTYGTGATYALGALVSSTSVNTVTGQATKNTSTLNTFVWRDAALQNTTTYDGDTASGSNPLWITTFSYNGLGQMTKAAIADGKPRTVTFTLDEVGQILRRDESNVTGQTGAPHEVWFRLADREIGYIGNNGMEDPTAIGSLAQMQQVSPGTGTFRNGTTTGQVAAGYAQALDPISAYEQGSRSGGYVVRSGDTLQSIARALYGDASLWYTIAEVNGLSGGSNLTAGQQIQLPSGVTRNHYTADSFRPYDPAQAIGDLSPTTPAPPRKGLFKSLLGAFIIALLGNIPGQLLNMALGLQDKFSFRSLAIAAVSAGVTAGVGSVLGTGAMFGNQIVGDVVRGVVSSAATQGIATATGLQHSFSWAGVAAAGVSAGVGTALGGALPQASGGAFSAAAISRELVIGGASLIANAATRSAIDGSSFGRNIIAGLPDVVGQAIARVAVGAARGGGRARGDGGDSDSAGSAIALNPPDFSLIKAINSTIPGVKIIVTENGLQAVLPEHDIGGDYTFTTMGGESRNFYVRTNGRLSFNADGYAELGTNTANWGESGGTAGNPVWVQNLGGGASIRDVISYGWEGGKADKLFIADSGAAGFFDYDPIEFGSLGIGVSYGKKPHDFLIKSKPVNEYSQGWMARNSVAEWGGIPYSYGLGNPNAGQHPFMVAARPVINWLTDQAWDLVMPREADFYAPTDDFPGGNMAVNTLRMVAPDLVTGNRPVSRLEFGLMAAEGVSLFAPFLTELRPVAGAGRTFRLFAAERGALRLTPQQVKAKIFGTAQSTGESLPGGLNPHAFQSYRESILLARNPEIESVFLNQGYNTGLGLAPRTISPNLRPDVLGRYFDGRVARIEVRSATDTPSILIQRNEALNPQIIQQGFTPLTPRVVPLRGQ